MSVAVCCVTGKQQETKALADGSPGLPRGWKRLGSNVYCPEAWADRFAIRCLSVPVAAVLSEGGDFVTNEAAAERWRAFRVALRTSWTQAFQLSNWCIREMALADNDPLVPTEKGPRLPKYTPPADLYQRGRAQWPDLDSQSLSSVLQRVRAKYSDCRWDTRITGKVSLPSYRYPEPFPVPAKDVHLTFVEGEGGVIPTVRLRVSGQRFTVRLKAGPGERRALDALKRVAAGELLPGELLVYEQVAGGGHQNGGERRTAAGANHRPTRVMFGFTIYMPREQRPYVSEAEGGVEKVLRCTTGNDRLWTVVCDGREHEWLLHEDHMRRQIAAHREQLQRISDDEKIERRRPKRERRNIGDYRNRLCVKQHRRLRDFCHKASAMLVGLASRLRITVLEYDDRVQDYMPSFPWFNLWTMIEQKARQKGITPVRIEASTPTTAP